MLPAHCINFGLFSQHQSISIFSQPDNLQVSIQETAHARLSRWKHSPNERCGMEETIRMIWAWKHTYQLYIILREIPTLSLLFYHSPLLVRISPLNVLPHQPHL